MGREGVISQPITPTPEFYTVSKNIIDPSVGLGGWTIAIRGMVEQEIDITYDELMQFPAVEQHATLTCISNPIGGDLIDNAIWVGARLSDVLDRAGVRGNPGRVAFTGAGWLLRFLRVQQIDGANNDHRLPDEWRAADR